MLVFGPAPPDESSSLPTRCVATLAGHEGAVLNVRYNEGGQYALSCGKDRTLRLWSLAKAALIKSYAGHGHEVRDVACWPDNSKLVSVGGDKQVFLWDVATGRIIRKFRGHDSAVNAVALGGGGDVVVTGGYDQSVRAWDTRSNSFDAIQTVAPFKDSVTSVLLDGHVITAASVDGTMRAFDCRAGRCRTDTLGAPVTVLSLSGDGACVLAALAASRLRLLDRASGALLADYAAPGRHVNAGARCGAGLLAGDAHVAAASENGRVTFWELVDAAVVASLQAHAPGKTVCGLACHPREAAMLSCATDGLVKAWVAPPPGQRGEED